jgi:hypothetical protein
MKGRKTPSPAQPSEKRNDEKEENHPEKAKAVE